MKPAKTVSRFTFHVLVMSTAAAMTIPVGVLIAIISLQLGLTSDAFVPFFGVVFVFFLFVSHVVVDRALKAVGLSQSGQMVEARRPAEVSHWNTPVEDVVEIRCARSISNGLALTYLGFAALVFVLFEVIIPRVHQEGRELLTVLYGLLLCAAALAYRMRYTKIIVIDSRGVTAARIQYSFWRTTIPWSQIASCELVVIRDVIGQVATAHPVLKDADGKDLFRGLGASLTMALPGDQQRVLRALKGRFPTLDRDPWEF
jgi:hypothetical protein